MKARKELGVKWMLGSHCQTSFLIEQNFHTAAWVIQYSQDSIKFFLLTYERKYQPRNEETPGCPNFSLLVPEGSPQESQRDVFLQGHEEAGQEEMASNWE